MQRIVCTILREQRALYTCSFVHIQCTITIHLSLLLARNRVRDRCSLAWFEPCRCRLVTAASGLILQNLFKHKKFTLSRCRYLVYIAFEHILCAFIASFVKHLFTHMKLEMVAAVASSYGAIRLRPLIQWQLLCSSFSFCRVSSQIVNFQLLLEV